MRRLHLIWRGALLGAIAVLGFWTATASGQSVPRLPTLTLPTVTLPTLPITISVPAPVPPPPVTVTVPPLPVTVTVPPLPVTVPPPPVAGRRPPAPPRPAPAPTQSATPKSGSQPAPLPGSEPAPLASTGQAGSQTASVDQAGRLRVRLRRLRAARTRSTRGRASRPTTTIAFWLSGPARVVFLVQSGGSDCSPAGRFTVKGRRGRNEIRFTGKIRAGRLQPGRYRVTPIQIRGARPTGRHAVGVQVLFRGSVPARITTSCVRPTGSSTAAALTEEGAAGATVGGAPPPSKPEASKPERTGRLHGALGAFKPPDLLLLGGSGRFPSPVEIAALALMWISAGAILAYILTSVRR